MGKILINQQMHIAILVSVTYPETLIARSVETVFRGEEL